jgi:hypothetical protein
MARWSASVALHNRQSASLWAGTPPGRNASNSATNDALMTCLHACVELKPRGYLCGNIRSKRVSLAVSRMLQLVGRIMIRRYGLGEFG